MLYNELEKLTRNGSPCKKKNTHTGQQTNSIDVCTAVSIHQIYRKNESKKRNKNKTLPRFYDAIRLNICFPFYLMKFLSFFNHFLRHKQYIQHTLPFICPLLFVLYIFFLFSSFFACLILLDRILVLSIGLRLRYIQNPEVE